MKHQSKCIGLFGGTFDPVHNGHIAAAESFLNSELIDLLWVVLTPKSPHKPEASFAPYSYRLQMLKEAFASIPNAKISDVEIRLRKPCYTIQTVQYLTKNYPEFTFYLCIGYDSFATFQNWHKWKQILEQCTLLVANRPGVQPKHIDQELLHHTKFVEHRPRNISSTMIRENIGEGESISQFVPASVLNFIKVKGLYK